MAYVSDLVGNISGAASIGVEIDTLIVETIAGEANSLLAAVGALESALAVHDFETTEEHMRYCAGTLRGLMDQVCLHGYALESEVADTYWPLPKYREMLFMKLRPSSVGNRPGSHQRREGPLVASLMFRVVHRLIREMHELGGRYVASQT